MPSCPDCGVVYDSMYSVQAHRRSGLCRAGHAAHVPTANTSPPSVSAASGGVGLPPLGDAFYRQLAHGDPAGPGVVPMNGADRDLEGFLALQRAQQAEELARRERQLLDQQVNLVLPTRQAQLQQTQDQLRNQLMQLKLNLFTQQQAQQQGANVDMEYLKNEVAAVRQTISSLQGGSAPAAEYGFLPPAANSWPLQGNNRAAMMAPAKEPRGKRYSPAGKASPSTRQRNTRGATRHAGEPSRRRARTTGGRRGRYEDDWSEDSYDDDSNDDSDDGYDDYSDEDSYDDEDDDYSDGGHRARHRQQKNRSRSSPAAASAAANKRHKSKRYSGSRSPGTASHTSHAPTKPSGSRKSTDNHSKRSQVFEDPHGTPSLADQLKGMMQAMRDEIQSLKASGSVAPPFPTSSLLNAGTHTMQLGTLEGLDLSIPLDDLEVSLKAYYMFNNSGEYVLEPAAEKVFAKNPPPLMRAASRLLLFSVPPMEFTVNKPHDMNVFVLQVKYRGRLLYWATIFAKADGAWTEGVRTGAFDLAAALQSTEDMIPGATVTGTVQPLENSDVLADAERFMRRASTTSNNGTGSPNDPRRGTVTSSTKDAADATAAAATNKPSTPSITPSEAPEPPKPMPGLPDLDPVPAGMPLLPGMPGNEGPFLAPTATAHMMKQKGPFKHFALPPPPGTSILEWRDRFTKQLEKKKRKKSSSAGHAGQGEPSPPPSYNPSQPNNNTGGGYDTGRRAQTSPRRRHGDNSPGATAAVVIAPVPSPDASGADFGNQVHSDDEGDSSSNESLPEAAAKPAAPAAPSQPSSPSGKVDAPAKEHNREEEKKVKIMAETPKRSDAKESGNGSSESGKKSSITVDPAATSPSEGILNTSMRQIKPSPPAAPAAPAAAPAVPPAPAPPAPAPPQAPQPPPAQASPPSPPQAKQPPPPPTSQPAASMNDSRRMSATAPRALLPIVDKAGNLVVPPNYKMAAPPQIAGVEAHDQPTTANACVVIGLAQPTDKPPQSLRHCGHGARGNEVDLFLDGVVGVPLHAICTRVVVYITDEVDPKTGNIMNPLRNPRVFMRKPDIVAYQALDSSNVEPEFAAKLTTLVGEGTHAVVIVEYVTANDKQPPIALGHCCLPINKRFFAGNFLIRLKLGDPRRSQERVVDDMRPAERIADEQRRMTEKYNQQQLEASVDAQALRNIMPVPPRRRAECVPMGYLIWRVDSPNQNLPYFEMPGQLPPSKAEIDIFNSRVGVGDKPPQVSGIKTPADAENRFVGGAAALSDNIGFIAPYSPKRGCFLRVEGVRGVGSDNAFHVVVGRLPMGPTGRNTFWTRFPSWDSDVGAPAWVDPPFVVTGMPYNVLSCAVFTLLKVTGGADGPYRSTPIAWTIAKLFLDAPTVMRQGTFILPWLAGPAPEAFLQQLAKQKMDTLFLAGLNNKSITFLQPPATMRLSQGDCAVVPQLIEDTPGRPAARALLMPAQMKNSFPVATTQGTVGRSLRQVHETTFGGGVPKTTLEKIDAAVVEFLKASAREL